MYRMILADDEVHIREELSTMYDWKAHDIRIAAVCRNGLEAYEAILDESPDLVLTDIRMPGMSGLEMIERLRSAKSDLSFIILSGYRDFEYARQAIALGVTQYLTKPLDEKSLWEAVENGKEQCRRISLPRMPQTAGGESGADLVKAVREYVFDHLSDSSLSLQGIARNVLFMNEDYVSHLFATGSGEKFSHFLNSTRVEAAKKLLMTSGLSISAIAERTGFGANPKYFSQVFKKYTGSTPSAFVGTAPEGPVGKETEEKRRKGP